MKIFKSGFSLMEMMVVLLITAIIAAASAPMISKKMIRSVSEEGSPWSWVENGIAYNWDVNPEQVTAAIGASEDASNRHSRLYIHSDGNGNPQLSFGSTANGNVLSFRFRNNSIIASNNNPANWPTNAVALGYDSRISSSSVAIGHNADAASANSIVIGNASAQGTFSTAIGKSTNDFGNTIAGTSSIAIGPSAAATGNNSIAIGPPRYGSAEVKTNTIASGANSVAIGHGAKATNANQIVLGNANSTVYIPGKLIVGQDATLGLNSGIVSVRIENGANGGHESTRLGSLFRYAGATKSLCISDGQDLVYKDLSDRRLKNVGKAFTGGLEQIKKLEVFNYTFKKDKDKTPRVGVMAQDLQKIFPNAVTKGDDGFLRIRMEDMFYAVVNAIKELDAKVDLLVQKQKKIDELEKKVNTLEKRLADLEKKVK